MTMLFRVCVEQYVINERQYAGIALLHQKTDRQAANAVKN
jgi:hypothetical protein